MSEQVGTRTKEVNLTTAHDLADGSAARVTIDAERFEIIRADDDATIRLGGEQDDPVDVELDEYQATGAARFGTILVENEASGISGAKLVVAVPSGYCRRRHPSSEVRITENTSSSSTPPRRLDGALAPGTAIDHGQEAAEELDVAEAEELRVRAQVSGISSTEAVNTAPRNGAYDIDSYETPAGAPRLVTVDAGGQTLRVYDASDPEDPVLLGSVNEGTLGTSWRRVVVDAADELAMIIVQDTGTDEAILAIFDISDPTAIPASSSVVYADDSFTGSEAQEDPAIDADRDLLLVADAGDVYLLDYSDPSAPVHASSFTPGGQVRSNVSVAPDLASAFFSYASGGELDLYTIGYAGGTLYQKALTVFSGVYYSYEGQQAYDPARQLLYSENSERLAVLDVASPTHPVALAELNLQDLGFTERFTRPSLAVDADRDLLYFKSVDSSAGQAQLNALDVSDPRSLSFLVLQFDVESGATSGGGVGALTYHTAIGAPYWPEVDDDVLGTVRLSLGRDRVSLYPLLTDGRRAADPVHQATLEDGREALVQATVVGEAKYEAVVEGRSGKQATVDFVERSFR